MTPWHVCAVAEMDGNRKCREQCELTVHGAGMYAKRRKNTPPNTVWDIMVDTDRKKNPLYSLGEI
jgi:hypothetical protein